MPYKIPKLLGNSSGCSCNNGGGGVVPTADQVLVNPTVENLPGAASAQDALEMIVQLFRPTVAQNAHGIALGVGGLPQLGRVEAGGNVILAQANNVETLASFWIVGVPDANTIILQNSGVFIVAGHGKTPGTELFLSDVTPGLIVEDPPTDANTFRQPVGSVLDANRFWIDLSLPTNTPVAGQVGNAQVGNAVVQ